MSFSFHSNLRAHFGELTLRVAILIILIAIASLPLAGQTPSAASQLPAPESNVKAPAGSYQLSCLILDMREDTLQALCQAVNGDWHRTELQNPNRCADIFNGNGVLGCSGGNKIIVPEALPDALGEKGLEPFQQLRRSGGANWQLEHETWTFKNGAPENVFTVAETTDGFLWLGGSSGLYRFDGRQFELFRSAFGEEPLSTNISCLYAPHSGGLWIAYAFGGVSFLDKGRLKSYGDLARSTGTIRLMLQDTDGIIWAVSLSSGLWRFEHSSWEHVGTEWNVPLKTASDMALDREGNLWVIGERMLLRLPRGSRQFQVVKGDLPFNAQRFGYTGRLVDHEGNIWFSSQRGLDRFFYTPLAKQELPGPEIRFQVADDDDGKVLIAGLGSTLYRIDQGKTQTLPQELDWEIWSMYRAPDNTIWLGTANGLWQQTLSRQHPSKIPNEPKTRFDIRKVLWRFTGRDWNFFGLPSEISDQGFFIHAMAQDRLGGMWVSLNRHGLYRLAKGVWTSYGGRKDLPTTGVVCEFTDVLGRVWFGYSNNQLAVLDGDKVQIFGPNDGLRVGAVTALYGRGPQIWIGGEFGLDYFDAGHIKAIHTVNDEWLRGITGLIETAKGDLWVNGLAGIFHIRRSELAKALRNPFYQVQGDHFGRRDGLPGFAAQPRPTPSVIKVAGGRIWFALSNGVVSVDPDHFEHSVPPPPISIQSVAADDKTYDPTFPIKLPAHSSSVQISYSAVSLTNPDAIRFRYKLQETDSDWHEVPTANPVSYRNLSPGSYHFSVSATDTNGVWSDKVATVEFTILPAFYQTRWFLLLCATALIGIFWLGLRWRMKQAAATIRARAEVRAEERVRIARDLHDTLLQGVQGLMLRFHVASQELPQGSRTRESMEHALSIADRILVEGRDRINRLRAEHLTHTDLADAFEAVAADFNDDQQVRFVLTIEGEMGDVTAPVLHELYYIGREAISNAFRHSKASKVAVSLNCDAKSVVLIISDNGRGFDPVELDANPRIGHWGLQGMRERSEAVGAQFECRSAEGKGTKVIVTVLAGRAYEKRSAPGRRAALL